MWKAIGDNIMTHKTYPKIVGETGGKDFVMVHKSANPKQVATALSRGALNSGSEMLGRIACLYSKITLERGKGTPCCRS